MDKPSGFQIHIFKRMKTLIPLSGSNIIKRKHIRRLLGNYSIPVYLHKEFLDDFEKFGFIKLHDRKNFEINKEINLPNTDIEQEDDRDVEVINQDE